MKASPLGVIALALSALPLAQAGNSTGCKGCFNGKAGCICANSVNPDQGWSLHFKSLFEQTRYKIVDFKGSWDLVATFDNRNQKGSQGFSVQESTGYEHTESTTVTNSWTRSLTKDLGNYKSESESFTHAVQHYSSETFEEFVTVTRSVNCPGDTLCNYRQRLLTATFALQSAPQIEVDGDKGPEQVSIHGHQFWFNNPYGGAQCQCDDNGLTHVTITWRASCWTLNPNAGEREQACPVKSELDIAV